MIEERGRVLSVEQGAVWVETLRRSACDACQARSGCGQSVLQRVGLGARQGFIRALSEQSSHSYRVGDEIIIGIPENAVSHGSAVGYLLPLVTLFAGALLAQAVGAAESSIVMAGLFGMGVGFAAVRWHGRRVGDNPAYMPRVVGRVMGAPGVVSDINERSEY